MKSQLIAIVAAVLVVGCGESQQSVPSPETKPVEPVAEAAKPEPTTAKAPDIPLWEAAMNGNIEAVKQHLAAGADVNAKDKGGGTSLHFSAYGGHKEIVELLIAKGADVNAKNNDGRTPLHYVAAWGHKEIVELLIAEGADVNARDDVGGTPLHRVAVSGHKETAELLIAKGADVNAKVVSGPKQGLTPLDAANETNHPEIADILRKHGGKTGEELKAAGK